MLLFKKGGLGGKKAIALIFLIVGIMLMFFIVSQGAGVYKSSREGVDRQGFQSARCVGFLYSISNVAGFGDELQFTFINEKPSTEDVHNLTVGDSKGNARSFAVNILAGQSFSVRVPVAVEENFTVYPDSCSSFPARCSLAGQCSYK